MAGILQKVRSGDPLVIPAATFNSFIDAAQAHRQRRLGGELLRDTLPDGSVLVRNESGTPRGWCDVLAVNGPIISRSANAAEFKAHLALRGAMPSATTHFGFAVLLEALDTNAIGRGRIAGVSVLRVRMLSEGHRFADLLPGDATRLRSAPFGPARLLWIEPLEDRESAETAWCVACLGSYGYAPFPARLTGWAQWGTVARWKYAWEECVISATGEDLPVTGGWTGSTTTDFALNLREINNVAQRTGTQGNSVNGAGADYPPGFNLQPIGGGTGGVPANPVVVWLTPTFDAAGNRIFVFDPDNSDDGTCEAP